MKKAILYLAHRIPYPPNKGDKIRSFHEIKALSENFSVDLACLADNPADISYASELRKLCNQVEVAPVSSLFGKVRGLGNLLAGGTISSGFFYRSNLQKTIDLWLQEKDYDAVFCFSSTMAEYVFRSQVFGALTNKPRLVMDYCDLDSDKWFQYANDGKFLSRLYKIEGQRLSNYEKRINGCFDVSVFVSQNEADLFLRNFPGARNVTVVGNGVDYQFFSPDDINAEVMQGELNLLFTGAMDYHANVDGVSWFCCEIFPIIQKHLPKTQFYIVGSNPASVVRKLADKPGITVTGFVDDVRPYYKGADISVIPLRLARGVQNKVLEAMAMGKAVVTTSKAADPLGVVHDKHVLIADSPDEFAEAVKTLADSPEKCSMLGAQAREFIKAEFDWNSNLAKLSNLCVNG